MRLTDHGHDPNQDKPRMPCTLGHVVDFDFGDGLSQSGSLLAKISLFQRPRRFLNSVSERDQGNQKSLPLLRQWFEFCIDRSDTRLQFLECGDRFLLSLGWELEVLCRDVRVISLKRPQPNFQFLPLNIVNLFVHVYDRMFVFFQFILGEILKINPRFAQSVMHECLHRSDDGLRLFAARLMLSDQRGQCAGVITIRDELLQDLATALKEFVDMRNHRFLERAVITAAEFIIRLFIHINLASVVAVESGHSLTTTRLGRVLARHRLPALSAVE
jgi:hypothetical protein